MSAIIEQVVQTKPKIKCVFIYPKDGKPSLPVHRVIRMAAAKAKMIENTKDFINIRAVRYIDECGVYACFYSYPSSPLLENGKAETE